MPKRKHRRSRLTSRLQLELGCKLENVMDALRASVNTCHDYMRPSYGPRLNGVPSLLLLAITQLELIQNEWNEIRFPEEKVTTTPAAEPDPVANVKTVLSIVRPDGAA